MVRTRQPASADGGEWRSVACARGGARARGIVATLGSQFRQTAASVASVRVRYLGVASKLAFDNRAVPTVASRQNRLYTCIVICICSRCQHYLPLSTEDGFA